jgi:hypothetical protein
MHRIATGLAAVLLLATPALAITAKEKMEICKFGAEDQKLTGAKAKTFIRKCMAKEDAPAKKPAKKPAAKPAAKN